MHLLLGKDLFQLSNLVSWWLYLECQRSSILPKALGVLILLSEQLLDAVGGMLMMV
jgi:hypothetical protein